MKILDYGIHMNEKLEPVMVFTLEVPLMIDWYHVPKEMKIKLEEFCRLERERLLPNLEKEEK